LVRIDAPDGKDWAFVPNPLSPNWELSPHLSDLLVEANGCVRELNGVGRTINNPSLLLDPLQRREALRSSSLEGTYATPEELLLYERDPKEPQSEHDRVNDWREVANYNHALHESWRKLATSQMPLSLRLVREAHATLLKGVRGRDKRPGQFRNAQVHVGSDRRYVPPPVNRMTECLDSLEKYMHADDHSHHPLILSYLVHYQFEAIHPFHDGNGRIGRVLLSLTTYQWCDLSLPWLYMSAFFERYKDEYVDNLFRVSTHGDWDKWIAFCLRGTIAQARDAIRRCEQLNALKGQYHAEADGTSPRAYQIIDRLFQSPVFEVSDVAEWCGVTKPTARADIRKLMKAGVVRYLEGQKPKRYYAPAIFKAAYSEELDADPEETGAETE
jgi:Fic family protein